MKYADGDFLADDATVVVYGDPPPVPAPATRHVELSEIQEQLSELSRAMKDADEKLRDANIPYVDWTFWFERERYEVTWVNADKTRVGAPQGFLLHAPCVVRGMDWVNLLHQGAWDFPRGALACVSVAVQTIRSAHQIVERKAEQHAVAQRAAARRAEWRAESKKPKKKPKKKVQGGWPPPCSTSAEYGREFDCRPFYNRSPESQARVRREALDCAIRNAQSWRPPLRSTMDADKPRVSPGGFLIEPPPKKKQRAWESTTPIVPETPWEAVVKRNAKRRKEAHLAALQRIESSAKARTAEEAKNDELFFSLADALRKKGVVTSVVRVALTTDERDRLAGRCDIASHVVGGSAHKMWYRDKGYGFSSWLYGKPPTNRGHYLVRVRLGRENYAHAHECPPSVALDFKYRIHMTPVLDDPYNTYLPPQEAPWIPPPEYPCMTQYETQLRNVNGRPNWTFNRSAAGMAYGQLLAEKADERAKARAEHARYDRMRSPLVGSIFDLEEW